MSSAAFAGRAATFIGLGWAGQTFLPKEYVDRINDGLRNLVPSGSDATHNTDRVSRHLSDLAQQVEKLTRQQGGPPKTGSSSTIVLQHEPASGKPALTALVLVSVAGYLYLRFWLGWRWDNFAVVTRASFDATVTQFTRQIDSVTELVANVRELTLHKIKAVKEAIDKVVRDVSRVHDDVKNVQADVDTTRTLAESCDRRIAETSAKQDYANRGIQALCAVVGELLQNAARTPAIENLRSFAMISRPNNNNRSLEQPESTAEPANQTDFDLNLDVVERLVAAQEASPAPI